MSFCLIGFPFENLTFEGEVHFIFSIYFCAISKSWNLGRSIQALMLRLLCLYNHCAIHLLTKWELSPHSLNIIRVSLPHHRRLQKRKEEQKKRLDARREAAILEVNLMTSAAEQSIESEQRVQGLVIVKALYGRLQAMQQRY